jgi:hypothetical protein
VASRLPPALIPPDRLRRVEQAAQRLPECYLAGLECRLVGRGQPVDLWICPALDAEPLRRAGAWLAGQPWEPLHPLARHLESQGPPWPTRHGAWTLEFDLDADEPLPLPSSFVTFGATEGGQGPWQILQHLWEGSRGQALGPEDRAALKDLLRRCPEGTLAGLGFLYPRAGSPARLMLAVPNARSLAGWLGRRHQQVEALFGGLAERLVAAAAIHPDTESSVSIEAYLWRAEAWGELAARLVRMGLCLPDRARALLRLAEHRAPSGGAWCSLNHVKMALTSAGQASVKAYPAFGAETPGDFNLP